MKDMRRESWIAGANNLASRDRLPENSVRMAVNLDPLIGGRLALRSGYEKAYSGVAVRAVLALGSKLLIAAGTELVEYDTRTQASRVLRSISGAGPVVGDELNGRLYFCTANEALEYDGSSVRPWGVPDVLFQPAISASAGGSLLAGTYQVAVTHTDQWGREGGTDLPAIISAISGDRLIITIAALPAGCTANLYVSPVDGSTLYLQRTVSVPGQIDIGSVSDDTTRCETILLRAPTAGGSVCAHNGVMVTGVNRHVQITRPMRPHLVDRAAGFFQYPSVVTDVLSVFGTLIVFADKVYSLSSAEGSDAVQRVAQKYPAVPGTAVLLPDGRGAWMTQYGQAIAGADGVSHPNMDVFSPVTAPHGAAGVLDHNGNQLIISTLSGIYGHNPMASTDLFLGEALNP